MNHFIEHMCLLLQHFFTCICRECTLLCCLHEPPVPWYSHWMFCLMTIYSIYNNRGISGGVCGQPSIPWRLPVTTIAYELIGICMKHWLKLIPFSEGPLISNVVEGLLIPHVCFLGRCSHKPASLILHLPLRRQLSKPAKVYLTHNPLEDCLFDANCWVCRAQGTEIWYELQPQLPPL